MKFPQRNPKTLWRELWVKQGTLASQPQGKDRRPSYLLGLSVRRARPTRERRSHGKLDQPAHNCERASIWSNSTNERFGGEIGTVGWARTTDLLFHRQAL